MKLLDTYFYKITLCTKTYTIYRFIHVNFNAWEFNGCDNIWAGIITNISDAIEKEFGNVIPRIFRLISVETIPRIVKEGPGSEEGFGMKKETTLFVHVVKIENGVDALKEYMSDFGVINFCDTYL